MKKRLFICLVTAATFICLMSCENPIMKAWWEEQGIAGNGGYDSNNGKVNPVVRWPNDIKGISGQKLSAIVLPCKCTSETHGTFTWTKPNTLLSRTRKQTYNVTFTPNDTSHYKTVTKDMEITVIPLNMVKIPAGTFMMGSPDSEPGHMSNEYLHQVTLRGFSMSEYTVTQELFELVMGNNLSSFCEALDGESETPEQLPITITSWYDTLVFCNKLSMMMGLTPAYSMPAYNNSTDPADWGTIPGGIYFPNADLWDKVEIVPGSNGYRMPTEAQWEYACRAGTTTEYNTGDIISNDTGWCFLNLVGGEKPYIDFTPHKVGILPPNAWGLYDMHGNVYEWCWDWYTDDYYLNSPTNDPMGPSLGDILLGFGHVIRGGSFNSFYPENLRSAARAFINNYSLIDGLGIRLVLP